MFQTKREVSALPAGPPVTWPEHPPAVLLVRGTLAVVAVALRLVVAGLAVHLEAVLGALLRGSGAVLGQVALACRRPANAARLLELRGRDADIWMRVRVPAWALGRASHVSCV